MRSARRRSRSSRPILCRPLLCRPPCRPSPRPKPPALRRPRMTPRRPTGAQGQTWPNLTRDCMEQKQSQKPARTAATDRVVKPASDTAEASPAAAGERRGRLIAAIQCSGASRARRPLPARLRPPRVTPSLGRPIPTAQPATNQAAAVAAAGGGTAGSSAEQSARRGHCGAHE